MNKKAVLKLLSQNVAAALPCPRDEPPSFLLLLPSALSPPSAQTFATQLQTAPCTRTSGSKDQEKNVGLSNADKPHTAPPLPRATAGSYCPGPAAAAGGASSSHQPVPAGPRTRLWVSSAILAESGRGGALHDGEP